MNRRDFLSLPIIALVPAKAAPLAAVDFYRSDWGERASFSELGADWAVDAELARRWEQ